MSRKVLFFCEKFSKFAIKFIASVAIAALAELKVFFVEMSFNQKYCKTLLEYFIDPYFYLIPSDVILIDYYTENNNYEVYVYDAKEKMHLHKDKNELWNFLK